MDDASLARAMEHLRPYVSVARPLDSPLSPQHKPPQEDAGHTSLLPSRPRSPSNPHHRTDPSKFGSRFLQEDDDIFEFNAWDSVPLTSDFLDFAEQQYKHQRAHPVTVFDKERFNTAPEKWWDRFYTNNSSNFFKDRQWLFKEFPALQHITGKHSGQATVLEVGCGAGNTAFPLLRGSENPQLKLHCCDFSKKAVEVVRESNFFDKSRMRVDVWDVASTCDTGGAQESPNVSLPPGLSQSSVDIIILVFIFSALSPSQWTQALWNMYAVLKPGGQILFRDYGRGDLAQVRFKKGRWMEENFYVRGDGTRVYFFAKEELMDIFGGAGTHDSHPGDAMNSTEEGTKITSATRPKFDILDLKVDNRMLVNRQRRLKMYRCWMHGHFRKPMESHETTATGRD